MHEQQKELALWGGGGLVLLLILGLFARHYGSQVQEANTQIDRLLPSYQRHYASGPAHTALEVAEQQIQAAHETQAQARRRIESVMLNHFHEMVENSIRRENSGRPSVSYNQVVDHVDSRYRALRARARRLNIGNLPDLPHEGADRIVRGDELEQEQQRSVQLAEVLFCEGFLEFLMEQGVHGIRLVEALPIITDSEAAPSYVSLGLRLQISMDDGPMNRFLRELREPSSLFSLEECILRPDQRMEGRYNLELAVRSTFRWPERWSENLIPSQAETRSSGSNETRTRGRSTRGRN